MQLSLMVVSGNNLMYFIITSRYTRILYLRFTVTRLSAHRLSLSHFPFCIFNFFARQTRLCLAFKSKHFYDEWMPISYVKAGARMNVKRKHEIMALGVGACRV